MVNIFKSNAKDPLNQAIIVFVGVLSVMCIAFLLSQVTSNFVSLRFYWLTTTAFLLFFSVFNSIASLASEDGIKFWGRSMYSYMGLAVTSGLLAWGFSGISIFDAGSYSWLFKVVTVVYIVFMTMVRTMKIIVEFAQKEEWNSPNLRKKKKQ
jgi:hypothetical protein